VPPKQMTICFIIVWVAVAVMYDVVVAYFYGTQPTISRIIHDWAYGNPVIAFALGVLCGHLFWSQKL
jgi:hypothetical protein